MPYIWNRKKPLHMIASPHRDGRLISGTVGHFGIDTIFGSTNRGGAAALRAMIRTLNAGDCVGITPDGPRGPHMRVSEGVVTLARMANIPIIPASCGVRRRKVLKSWDRFIVALPFSSGVFVWGEPITVPRRGGKQALEGYRLKVEQALTALTAEADRLTGHHPIEAAPTGPGNATS